MVIHSLTTDTISRYIETFLQTWNHMKLKCHQVFRVGYGLWVMVLNTTFNNISVILQWLVLLVEETGVPG